MALLDHVRERREAMLATLADLVGRDSPSRDKGALDALADVLEGRFRAIGGAVERLANPDGGDHIRATVAAPGASATARPALVLGHFDTVWPLGTSAARPWRVEGDRAFGPGVFDMKASLVLAEAALEAIRALGLALPRPIVVLWTSDEEIGSPDGRHWIEAEARRSAYALVLESPLPGGRLKTARKGVGRFTLEVEGRAAHAGIEPEKGVNAIVELAHQIVKVQGLPDPAAGTTLNVGTIAGGTTPNVVPAEASARLDVRVASKAEADRIEAALRALRPVVDGARLRVVGGFDRPPMERSPAIASLFGRARELARSLGLELTEGATGGASDGNFTAALGLPTLDGLGALGAGAHAEDEQILIDSLPERAALLAVLLLGL